MKNKKTPSDSDVINLISECTAYDFKEMLEIRKPKSWIKTISAFANGLGGSLFLGINDNGEPTGLKDIKLHSELISQLVNDRLDPVPEIVLTPYLIKGKDILEIKVNAGHFTPYYYSGDGQRIAYIRIGNESVPATGEDMKRLVLKGTNRSYDSIETTHSVIGSEVHLDIYENRLTIISPGGMYCGQFIQNLDIKDVTSDRRNPILADVMAQLDYMEKRGSGLSKICNSTKELEGFREKLTPSFESTSSHFKTTLYKVSTETDVTNYVTNYVTNKQSRQLSKHQQDILKLIKQDQYITGAKMSQILHLSERTIRRELAGMKDIIQHEGKKNKGKWIIMTHKHQL